MRFFRRAEQSFFRTLIGVAGAQADGRFQGQPVQIDRFFAFRTLGNGAAFRINSLTAL
jgi:hypothetical protein